ncbi:MAG: hypothetical protein IT580_13635, partial [Verrucomicrobiales bacterium]|nr:hypothetical protein [Verrucomicrobiales bacterium]
DPFRASNGSLPLVTNEIAVVPTGPGAAYGIDLSDPAARLSSPRTDIDGDVNTTFLQGTLRLAFAPNWGSDAPDCTPGTGPGATIDLVGVGPFALRLDARGTNLFFTTPNGAGGMLTNVQASFRACSGDYDPEFPIEVQVSYSTNATALFINGGLVARGSGVVAAPDAATRAAGVHFGSRPDGTGQLRGILDSVVAYNIPLNLVTNPTSMAVSLQAAPQGVQLHWQGVTNWPHRIERRESGGSTWSVIATALPPRFTDTNLVQGRTYDYRLSTGVGLPLELLTTTDPGYLLARAGIAIEPAHQPGRVLLVVDRTLTNDVAFATSVETLIRDLWSEGWTVSRFNGPRHDDVTPTNNPPLIAEVKGWITNQFAAAPESTRALLLLGHLPIPFSGMLSPDGHPYRPLPADAYYGDVDGIWTDSTNWLAAPNVAVPNLAGDGAFDQELVPPNPSGIAELEIPVGRVDLALLPAFAEATPARSELDLLNRYLAKTRQYRRAEVVLPEALVAGAFFTSNLVQEAVHPYTIALKQFAARIRTAQYGTNVPAFAAQDFLTAGTPAVWGLLGGFGNGPGGIHPNPVVNAFHGLTPRVTANLTAISNQPPVAFSLIEASFASEWNIGNHLGRGLLAAQTNGLSWSYAGAPRAHWQLQGTFLNEPLSQLWKQTFNDAWQFPFVSTTLSNSFGTQVKVFTGQRSQGAYIYLASHGDPTLRPKPLAPVHGLTSVTNQDNSLTFQWNPGVLSNSTYHVYRSTNGPGSNWTRLTGTALATNRFTDASPPAAPRTYAVRVAILQSATSGTFTNLSAATLWP